MTKTSTTRQLVYWSLQSLFTYLLSHFVPINRNVRCITGVSFSSYQLQNLQFFLSPERSLDSVVYVHADIINYERFRIGVTKKINKFTFYCMWFVAYTVTFKSAIFRLALLSLHMRDSDSDLSCPAKYISNQIWAVRRNISRRFLELPSAQLGICRDQSLSGSRQTKHESYHTIGQSRKHVFIYRCQLMLSKCSVSVAKLILCKRSL